MSYQSSPHAMTEWHPGEVNRWHPDAKINNINVYILDSIMY